VALSIIVIVSLYHCSPNEIISWNRIRIAVYKTLNIMRDLKSLN
jgi:hypothetical protein